MHVRRVFLDANVIIEAFRISAWSEFSQGCLLETVQECEKEALTGSTTACGRVEVDAHALRAGLRHSHAVGKVERRALIGAHHACLGMDPGEKDLFAYLFANHQLLTALIVVSSSDKGVIVRAKDLGWLHNLVSLEELLLSCGVSRAKMSLLEKQHKASFLADVRTKVMLGVIP
jgi:hypothetical protein